MLTQSNIIEIASAFFPNNYGIIITGSQQKNEILKKETDIDVVVLDIFSGSQWNIIMEKDGYAIEFIVLPATDLDNVLDNGRHEPKNGLLMLAQGKILSDPYGMVEKMQDRVKVYFSTVQYNTGYEYNRYLIELMKLPSLFNKELTAAERIIVLGDFINIASILETIRVTKWSSRTKHKLRHLKSLSPAFLEKIEHLFHKGVNNEFGEINAYIKFYEKEFTVKHLLPTNRYKALIVDLGYTNFSLSQFVNVVLPLILSNEVLRGSYSYFYQSPRKYSYKYKYNVSLYFTIEDEDGAVALIDEVEKAIAAIPEHSININCFCEEDKILPQIKLLNIAVNKFMHASIVGNNDIDRDCMISLFSKLCFYLKNSLNLSAIDFRNINSFIWQKWILTNTEQVDANGYPAMMKIRAERIAKADEYYKKTLPELLQLVMADNVSIAASEEIPKEIFALIDNVIKASADFMLPQDDMNIPLFNATQYQSTKSAWLYKYIIEELLLLMNIYDTGKFKALYACSRALSESEIETEGVEQNQLSNA